MKKNRKRNGIYREKDFYIFVGLWIIGFIAFTLIPMGYSLYASFTKWDGVSAPQFNGVQNYIRMFVQDERFWGSLKKDVYKRQTLYRFPNSTRQNSQHLALYFRFFHASSNHPQKLSSVDFAVS